MVHQRIVKPVLERLDRKRAAYFSDIVDALEGDPRTQRRPNLVYLVLRETMQIVPMDLPRNQFVDLLFSFVESNRSRLGRKIFARDFVQDPSSVREVTNDFIRLVIDIVIEKCKTGEIDSKEKTGRRYSWPYDNVDLPYVD